MSLFTKVEHFCGEASPFCAKKYILFSVCMLFQLPCRDVFWWILQISSILTKRYGRLRGPTSSFCRGLWPRFFCPLGEKMAHLAVFAHFRPFLVLSSNLINFNSNQNNLNKKIYKLLKEKNKKKKKKKLRKQL